MFASHGLWDCLSSEEVVGLVGLLLEKTGSRSRLKPRWWESEVLIPTDKAGWSQGKLQQLTGGFSNWGFLWRKPWLLSRQKQLFHPNFLFSTLWTTMTEHRCTNIGIEKTNSCASLRGYQRCDAFGAERFEMWGLEIGCSSVVGTDA